MGWPGSILTSVRKRQMDWQHNKTRNSQIRWYLVEAAQKATRYDPKLKPFYERVSRKKGNQKAVIAVARKMLVSVYSCVGKKRGL